MPSLGTKSLRGSESSKLLEDGPDSHDYHRPRKFRSSQLLVFGGLALLCLTLFWACARLVTFRPSQDDSGLHKLEGHQSNSSLFETTVTGKRAPTSLQEAVAKGDALIEAMDAPASSVSQSTFLKQDLVKEWGYTSDTRKSADYDREPLDLPFEDTLHYVRKQKDRTYKEETPKHVQNLVWKHDQYVTRSGPGGNRLGYPPTMAVSDVVIDPQYIGVRFAESAARAARDASFPLPELKHWSDVVFLQYSSIVPADQMPQLGGVVHSFVTEESSLDVLRQVFAKIPKVADFPGTAFELGKSKDEFKALLAIPNGAAVAHLLAQHKTQFGQKCISRVLVWWPSESWGHPNLLYLFKNGPCASNVRKRAPSQALIAQGQRNVQIMYANRHHHPQSAFIEDVSLEYEGWVSNGQELQVYTSRQKQGLVRDRPLMRVLRTIIQGKHSTATPDGTDQIAYKVLQHSQSFFCNEIPELSFAATGAELQATFHPNLIEVSNWVDPKASGHRPLPKLSALSDVMFLQHVSLFYAQMPQLGGISFLRVSIPDLAAVIDDLHSSNECITRRSRQVMPGIVLKKDNDLMSGYYFALLGTELGCIVTEFLAQHKDQLGIKYVSAIHVWTPPGSGGLSHVIFKFENAPAGSTVQKRVLGIRGGLP